LTFAETWCKFDNNQFIVISFQNIPAMRRFLEIINIAFIFICFLTIVQSCKKPKTPEVTTQEVLKVTVTSAVSGGNVTNNGGAEVTDRGVCWGTSTENDATTAWGRSMVYNSTRISRKAFVLNRGYSVR
jgi:hypothetical protein